MALGSVVIDLAIRTGAFETDTKKAERRLKEMEKTAKRVGAAIGTAIVGGVTAATYAIRSQITAMDEMSKAAQRAFMPTEEFSQLAYAGSLADVEIGNLTTSMGRLSRAQADASRGLSTQIDAFKKMGIEFANADGSMRSGMAVLKDFADVLQRRKGDPEVMAAGMQIFGRSFQNLIPLLSQGRAGLEAAADEADRLGITLDTRAGQQAEAFNDNLSRLKMAVDGVWRAVAADLLPDLVRLTEQFVATTKEGERLDKTAGSIADTIRFIGNAARYTVTPLFRLREVMQGITTQAGGFGKILRGQLRDGLDEYRSGTAAIDHAFRSMALPGNQFSGVTGGMSTTAQDAAEAARARAEEAARKEAEAREAAAKAAAAGAKERAEAERELAEAIRATEEAEREATEAEMAAEERRLGWMNRIDDMVAQVEGPVAVALVNYRRQMADLNAALAVGEISMENYQRGAQALGQTLGNVAEDAKRLTDEMSVFAEKAAQNIQSFLGDAMYDLLDGNFKDIGKSFSNMIKRMLAEMAASKLLDMLSKLGAANSGTWWGSMLGGLSGKRAAGGPVSPGGTYLVGERGPELLHMGNASGRITPNHMVPAMAAAGGMQVIVNNHGPQRVNAREESQQMPDGSVLRRMVIDVVAEDLASGGTLAKAGKARFGWREQV